MPKRNNYTLAFYGFNGRNQITVTRENCGGRYLAFARKQGWRASGRAAWVKSDGTTVYFIALEVQLAAVPAGAKVHRVSRGWRAV